MTSATQAKCDADVKSCQCELTVPGSTYTLKDSYFALRALASTLDGYTVG
jgi:hypothetical protein